MEAVKPLIMSKGAIGSLIAAIAALLSLFGIALSADDIQFLTNNAYGLFIAIVQIIGFISAIVGFVGRLRAKAQIGGMLVADPLKAPDPAAVMRVEASK